MIKTLPLFVVVMFSAIVSADDMNLSWNAVPDAVRYRMFFSDQPFLSVPPDMNDGDNTVRFIDTAGVLPSHKLVGLLSDTQYWVCVKAVKLVPLDPLYSTDCSNFITGIPDPVITSVISSSVYTETGRELTLIIEGRNFRGIEDQFVFNEMGLKFVSVISSTSDLIMLQFEYMRKTESGPVDLVVYVDEGLDCNFSNATTPDGRPPYDGCVNATMSNAFVILVETVPGNVDGFSRKAEQ